MLIRYLRAQAHAVLHGALHGAAEHDASLELRGDVLRDQLRIQLRFADLLDADVHRDPHLLGHHLAQLVDVLALLADHHAGARRVNGDVGVLRGTIDLDSADGCLGEALLEEARTSRSVFSRSA